MNTNGFREDEPVTRKVRVNGQWEARTFPIIGGRLRLAHEQNENMSLQTKLVSWDGQYAAFKCCVATGKGRFIGYGAANSQRDFEFSESLIELAETRSIARALRFAGFGLEFTGAEEVSHVPSAGSGLERTTSEEGQPPFSECSQNNKPETKSSGNGNGKSTQAQCRALWALTKKARYAEEDIANLLSPRNAVTFQDLTREDASRLISYLQTEAAA